MKGKDRFFLLKILDVLTKRIKSKVIFFEVFIILFVALSIGLFVNFYMDRTLTDKAHLLSERIVKDLTKTIENNYTSIPTTDEAVKSFNGTAGILYLGYNGFIVTAGKPVKVELYIGKSLEENFLKKLESSFKKDLPDFQRQKGVVNLPGNELTLPEPAFSYYMPVFVKAGNTSKRIGNIHLLYSKLLIDEEIQNVRILITIITCLIIILGIYISIRGANSIVHPIVHLTGIVKRFSSGDMSVRVNLPAKDEIGILANSFDEMIVSIKEKLEMQKFVSDSTVKMIKRSVTEDLPSHHKDAHTERKEVTLFFSDIRGFTSMSEKLDPQEVVNILNEYLDAQSNIIKQYKGDIDKFVGDEIVAVFEDDGMHTNAVIAAVETQKILRSLNEARLTKGLYPVEIGIGINSGEVVMGSIGSHERMDFTVIGDNVNLAARLCGAAGKNEIIIARSVYEKIKGKIKNKLTPLEPINVKGKSKPIEVYRVEY